MGKAATMNNIRPDRIGADKNAPQQILSAIHEPEKILGEKRDVNMIRYKPPRYKPQRHSARSVRVWARKCYIRGSDHQI